MILIAIKIGAITTLNFKDWDVIPDDRQTMVETIGSVEVQDFGHVEEGDKYSCKVTVSAANADILYDYWHNRIRVTIEDNEGKFYENMRVVVKRYNPVNRFKDYVYAELEFWRK